MAGIFRNHPAVADLYTVYKVRLRFRERIAGGTPKDPKVLEGWIASQAGLEQQAQLQMAVTRAMQEQGAELPFTPEQAANMDPDAWRKQVEEASVQVALQKQTNGFKTFEGTREPYIEQRAVKACIKEVTNILYAGGKWAQREGYKGKSPRSVVAERVFVEPDRISLGVAEPTGVELFIGHVNGPSGSNSTLTYFEYVYQAEVEFVVKAAEDVVPADVWPRLWTLAEDNGIGALRSQGYGKFDVLAWDKIGREEMDTFLKLAEEKHVLDDMRAGLTPVLKRRGVNGQILEAAEQAQRAGKLGDGKRTGEPVASS